MEEHVKSPSHEGSESSTSRVVQFVRDAIAEGELWPNQRLVEAELAEKLGVSRTPVREAIRELSRLGLVKTIRNRGAFVLPVDSKELREIYATRSVLEGWAAGLAAARLTQEKIDELASLNDRMRKMVQDGNHKDLIALNDDFHRILYEACDNDLLRELIANLVERTPAVRFAVWRSEQVMATSVRSHEELLDALRARDGEAAERIVRSHIRWTTLQPTGPDKSQAPLSPTE